jgi:hypothetical protein
MQPFVARHSFGVAIMVQLTLADPKHAGAELQLQPCSCRQPPSVPAVSHALQPTHEPAGAQVHPALVHVADEVTYWHDTLPMQEASESAALNPLQ